MLYDYEKQKTKREERGDCNKKENKAEKEDKRKTGRQTGHDREKCKVERGKGGQEINNFMMRIKQRIITIFTVCDIFFYTITAQHCRGINTAFLKG